MSRPVCLIILDGFGISPETEGNPIRIAKMPVLNRLIAEYPYVALAAAEQNVGLSFGEMGNSEVGHMGLGSGQVIYQTLPRISGAIENESFFTNAALLKAIAHVKKKQSRLHLVGLCSNGGIHAHIDHLLALFRLCKDHELHDVAVHAILDGRDTAADVGIQFITAIEESLNTVGVGAIATIAGRQYSMDRDGHWDRIEAAYRLMVDGVGERTAQHAVDAIKESYDRGVHDEEFQPTVIVDRDGVPRGRIQDDDAVIFFNFRGDRARQLTKAFVLPTFDGFTREGIKNLCFVTMTEYETELPVFVAFPPVLIDTPLASILAKAKKKQYHIAETEKYAHVTYFFNGGTEAAFPGEVRELVPSPVAQSYDARPEMSAHAITEKLIGKIKERAFDFYLINYANPDMVGHTGNLQATVQALDVVDTCVGRVVEAMGAIGGVTLITSDHGNCEVMIDPVTGRIDKEHSTNAVPLFVVDDARKQEKPRELVEQLKLTPPQIGILADVAPTILEYMDIAIPKTMTGRSLLADLV
ncbi:2,3-bisphosphoglycerate-independent phosphoglycerate mutase [Candidatus Uhrbacteria bacterium]|nr:2,3-bisphosphoglycerate-independent phosphoglycerate mutase [Candidatus Uhrbacteria bacterium]